MYSDILAGLLQKINAQKNIVSTTQHADDMSKPNSASTTSVITPSLSLLQPSSLHLSSLDHANPNPSDPSFMANNSLARNSSWFA